MPRSNRALLLSVFALLPALLAAAEPAARQERGNLVFEGVPGRDAVLAQKLGQYRQSRQATFLDWLPDGGMLVATRFGDVEQVHRVTAPLGMREQLTFYPEPVTAAQASHATGFVFLKDQAGDGISQIYYYPSAAHVQQLTTGRFLHGSPVWSNDGKRLAFFGTERDGVSHDVYVLDIGATTAPRLIAGGQQDTWYPLDWSADDRKLLLWKFVSSSESALYIADVYTGTLTPLEENGHKSGIQAAKFAPDGRSVYMVSDEDGEFAQLRFVDPVSHEVRKLTANIPWDIEAFDVSADGRYVAYVANADGRSRLTVLDTSQKLEQSPAGLPDGVIGNLRFDKSGRRLAMSAEAANSPRDVYVYDLNRSALERWTRSEPGPVDASTFIQAELVRYPTWDRRTICAYLYRPRTPGPHPVLIDLHDGPELQARARWNPFIAFLVNELGYAVIQPNVRGSSGYGKTFLKLDNGPLREDAVKDIGSLIVWLGLQSGFDRDHVLVMGNAYGGYLALATLAAYGDRLKGGIVQSGINNFVSYLETSPPFRQEQRRAEFGDEREPKARAFLQQISPLNKIALIRRPVFIAEGLADAKLASSESQQIAWRMRSKGTDVWYLAAKDESRDFQRKPNQDVMLETAAMFLARYGK